MSSQVFICNLALSHVSAAPISSIDEASAEARACKLFYDHIVRICLSYYPWDWAKKTDALAQISNDKSQRWGYAFQAPGDSIKIRRILDQLLNDYIPPNYGGINGGWPYAIEGQKIYTDLQTPYCEYTRLVDDVGLYPDMFVEALAFNLAARIAMPLTKDPNIRAGMAQEGIRQLAIAASHDANQSQNTSTVTPDYIAVRGGDPLTMLDRWGR